MEADSPVAHVSIQTMSEEIVYPSEIKFRITGTSEADLKNVVLRYTLGNSEVEQYTYMEFSGSSNFSANGLIPTDGESYVPPGTTITYRYEVVTSSFEPFTSVENVLSYLDPSYTWTSHKGDYLTLFYHDISKSEIVELSETIDELTPRLRQFLGSDSDLTYTGVIINNSAELLKASPKISQAAINTRLYGGFAFNKYGLFIIGGLSKNSTAHEMTHLVVSEVLNSPSAKVPAWLNEGIAMYFEPDNLQRSRAAIQAYKSGVLKPLSQLRTSPGRPTDVRVFYAHSHAVVKYLINTYENKKFQELLVSLQNGTDIETAMKSVYGFSENELDFQWRKSLEPKISEKFVADLGLLSPSLLILAAILIFATITLGKKLMPYNNEDEEDYPYPDDEDYPCENQRYHY